MSPNSSLRILRLDLPLLAALVIVATGMACGGDDTAPGNTDSGAGGQSSGSGGAGGAGSGSAGSGGGGSGGSSGAAGSAGAAGSNVTSDIDLYGSLNITLEAAIAETMSPARTTVIGKVYDGPTPSPAVWAEKAQMAGCTLSTPSPVLCEPTCGGSGACVKDNTCAPYPKATPVGTITITGVGSSALTLDPIADNYQPKAGSNVPFPPCTEGGAVELSAAGGTHAAFTASVKCIAPLDFKGPYMLTKGKPLSLKWGAPAQANIGKIFVKIDLSHHGGAKGKIECEVADNGALEIPAALVDALVDLGVAGFPTVALTRKVVAAGSGKAKNFSFTIASPVEIPVEIPGLKSCSMDTDCPSGQACQSDRTCK